MFYRIGDAEVISLDSESIVSRIALQGEHLTITFRDGHSIPIEPGQADYARYQQFIVSCPLLVSELQAQTLRMIQADYADPFFDEMPRTLFTMFQALPQSHDLELHLSETGAGSLWTKGTHTHCILEWPDFQEGLQCLTQEMKREQFTEPHRQQEVA